MSEYPIPARWKEILYFHQHPEQHPDSDFVCDDGEERQVVLWAARLEAQNTMLKESYDRTATWLGEKVIEVGSLRAQNKTLCELCRELYAAHILTHAYAVREMRQQDVDALEALLERTRAAIAQAKEHV